MAITVTWDNEAKTIIRYQFKGNWTFKEFRDVYERVYEMLDEVNHIVHAIVDLENGGLFPKDTLTEMRRLTFEQHANGGITVIITDRHMAHALYNFLKAVSRRFSEVFHLANTLDDAYAIIETHEAQQKQSY